MSDCTVTDCCSHVKRLLLSCCTFLVLAFSLFCSFGHGEMLGCERKSCRPPFSISHVPLLTLLTDFTCITVSTCQCQKKKRVEKMKIRDETGREDTHFAHASANTSTNTQCIPDPVIVVFLQDHPKNGTVKTKRANVTCICMCVGLQTRENNPVDREQGHRLRRIWFSSSIFL